MDGIITLDVEDTFYLDPILLDENGILRPVPMSILKEIPDNHLKLFALRHGIYQFVTIEMLEWLKNELEGYNAIEICAGYGTIGRSLGIPITDIKLQDHPGAAILYALTRQPTIKYPADVIQMEALDAVKHFQADAVVGAFVTQYGTGKTFEAGIPCSPFGPKETEMLKMVKKYIVFGNKDTHKKKHIYSKPHKELAFDWIFSRAINNSLNRVWVFQQ